MIDSNHQVRATPQHPAVVGTIAVTAALVALLARPRSFGGDFWLHLWLIRQNSVSWSEFGVPAMLTSFSPVGTLSPIMDYTGGAVYSALGLVDAAGLSTYHAVVLGIVAACLCCYTASRLLLTTAGVPPWTAALVAAVPLTFPFVWGDGLGRGGVSSMLAGLFSAAALILVLRRALQRAQGMPPSGWLAVAAMVALTGATHLPSFVILGGLGLPAMGICLIVAWGFESWKEIVASAAAALLGAAWSAAYWLPAVAFNRESSFDSKFYDDVSKGFAAPDALWSVVPTVPRVHDDFWAFALGEGFQGPTSLTSTQPTVLMVVLLSLACLTVRRWRLVLGLATSLIALYACVVFVDQWHHLPEHVRSLQYTFRLLYLPIPFVVGLAAVALAPESLTHQEWTIRRAIACGALALQGVFVVAQILEINNLSLHQGEGEAVPTYQYDVAPEHLADHAPAAPFWYSALESVPTDNIDPGFDGATSCPAGIVEVSWQSWPGQLSRRVDVADGACFAAELRVPVSWLRVEGASEVFRTTAWYVVAVPEPGTTQIELSLAMTSPQVVGAGISIASILIATGVALAQRRRRRERRGGQRVRPEIDALPRAAP